MDNRESIGHHRPEGEIMENQSPYQNYDDASRFAWEYVKEVKQDIGIERIDSPLYPGGTAYIVKHIPSAGKRFGVDARCEVVPYFPQRKETPC